MTLQAEETYCAHCSRVLDSNKITWLEVSFKTGRWYEAGKCPEEESQGGFPHGAACARAVLRKQTALTNNLNRE